MNKSTMGWPDRAALALDRWMATRLGLLGMTAFVAWMTFVMMGIMTRHIHSAFAVTVLVPLMVFMWLKGRSAWRSTPWRPEPDRPSSTDR